MTIVHLVNSYYLFPNICDKCPRLSITPHMLQASTPTYVTSLHAHICDKRPRLSIPTTCFSFVYIYTIISLSFLLKSARFSSAQGQLNLTDYAITWSASHFFRSPLLIIESINPSFNRMIFSVLAAISLSWVTIITVIPISFIS